MILVGGVTMETYFTSDLHFGHENILSSRPQFANLEQMSEELIKRWNDKVSPGDDVYILGDLAYRSAYHISYYLDRMKGHKHLILGNHDGNWMKNVKDISKYFESVDYMVCLNHKGKTLTLCHYPMLEWPRSRYADQGKSYLLHGHIHNNKNLDAYAYIKEKLPAALNCGVDVNNYQPVTFDELIKNNDMWYERD